MKKAVRLTLIFSLSTILLLLTPFLSFLILTRDCKIDENKLIGSEQNVLFLDKYGEKLDTISMEEKKTYTPLSSLSPETKQAFLSIEDKRFYSHKGINLKRMGKAFLENVKTKRFSQGASTISQQLIKNTHLSGEKTLKRKLKEIRLTFLLEQSHSKDEILELYLNTIYFGHSMYGIGNASRYYFDKNPDELTIAESAMLAGLLRSPNHYSPFQNPEKCLKRRNLVLAEMEKDGVMSDIIKKAKEEKLPKTPNVREENSYLDLAMDELDKLMEQEEIHGENLVVTTGYDPKIQALLPSKAETDQVLCVADNQEKTISAFHTSCGMIKRLPGSLIKPLLVYAPAIEEDLIVPQTPLLDEKQNFGDYSPSNFNDVYRGYISAKEALALSANLPAVKLLNELGVERAKSYLDKMELPTEENGLCLALGGMREGYTLKKLVDAYSVFTHEGNFTPYSTIVKIESNSRKIYEKIASEKKVFSKETTDLTNLMLNYTTKEGTGKKLSSLPFYVYAKTGTVGTEKGNTDAYSIAFTSEHTIGIWLGNADYSHIQETGGSLPTTKVKEILESIYEEHTPTEIKQTGQITQFELDKRAYEEEHKLVLADPLSPVTERIWSYFKKGKEPKILSHYYTNPTIPTPKIKYESDKIIIDLPERKYYTYKVERSSIHSHTLLYNDIQSQKIIDFDIMPDTTYLYTITPICFGQEGTPIILPKIHTGIKKEEDQTDPPIAQKEWWIE